jgi:hypothetical protein
MIVRVYAALLVISTAAAAGRADEDNPYKNTKVGDYATYKMNLKVGGTTSPGTSTQTVTEKTDKEATVKVTGSYESMGKKQDIDEVVQKIDLTKPYDPTKVGGLPPGIEVKIEKLKEGKEKVKAGGKEYECAWTTYKLAGKSGDQPFSADVKAWMSKEVPMGMVRMEMTAEAAKMKIELTMELESTGSGKK